MQKGITMTKEPIMIDGVDVSGCDYYFDNKCRCMDASIMQDFYSCPQCNINPNCYYKKWQRKEQECEQLKEKYLNLKEQNGSYIVQLNTVNEQLDQLKVENDSLKNELMQTNCYLEADKETIDQLKEEYKTLLLEHSGCYRKEWVDEQIRIKKNI